jgi:hypothetical protein
MTARPRRWLILALAPLAAVSMMLSPASPANADPDDKKKSSTADDGEDNPLLNDVLDSTGRRYLAARSAVKKSTKTQLGLALRVKNAEAKRDLLLPEVGAVAAQQYRTGGISSMGFLLNTDGPDGFLKKAVSLEEINALNDGKLRELYAAIDEVTATKTRLDQEVKAQKQNLALMEKQKESAENALAQVGGKSVTGGFVVAKSRVAAPAPRNSDGEFGAESCNVDDPTTGGCITSRTLHMLKETQKAGFDRFVGCHRNGGPFEHPKGRACDWSLQERGFAVAHNADMKTYGNNLMAFLVRNADRLGIYYVIWYKQIWFPTRGWSAYHGPSAHTDHVHVSML